MPKLLLKSLTYNKPKVLETYCQKDDIKISIQYWNVNSSILMQLMKFSIRNSMCHKIANVRYISHWYFLGLKERAFCPF